MAAGTKSGPGALFRRGFFRNPRFDQYRRTWYFLRRNTLAMVGLGILAVIILIAIFAATSSTPWYQMTLYCSHPYGGSCSAGTPGVCVYTSGPPPAPNCYLVPAGHEELIGPTISLSPLSLGPLPLGALSLDSGGAGNHFYSVFQGLLRGSDWSLLIAGSIVGGGALIGLFVGVTAGYYGGLMDEALMRFVDIFLSIPQLLFVIVVGAVVFAATGGSLPFLPAAPAHIFLLIIAFLVTWWPFYARLVRGQVLVTREQKFVEAAKASGAKNGRIITRHIIPNSVYPIFVQMSLDVGTIPLLIGALVFIGFVQILPSQYFPEWGAVAALGSSNVVNNFVTCQLGTCFVPWWQILFPGLALFLFAISVNFFADGLRDALDPRLRR